MVSDDEIHMDLQRFRELYANNSGVVECVIRIFIGFGADITQSQSTEFLHNVPLKSSRSNFCVFLGGTKCGRENDEKVS